MRTIGTFQLSQIKFDSLDFAGKWLKSFGRPEKNFSMIIYGESGNGKTDFTVQYAKYLSTFARVLYLSHEEGISSTIQGTFDRHSMREVSGRVIVAEKANIDELITYLKKRNSPGTVIIDSLDYMRLTTEQYKMLRSLFPKKAFIIIAWSKGDLPKSQYGKDIEYMSDIKVRVKGYVAYPRCRYGGNQPFVIWEQGARKLNPPTLFDMLQKETDSEQVKEALRIDRDNGEEVCDEGDACEEAIEAQG